MSATGRQIGGRALAVAAIVCLASRAGAQEAPAGAQEAPAGAQEPPAGAQEAPAGAQEVPAWDEETAGANLLILEGDELAELLNRFYADAELQDYAAVATKVTQPVQLTAASIWVVTAQQIERAGYRSVAEALASVPGIVVAYDLSNYHVVMRGAFGGSRAGSRLLKILIDGVPVSYAQSETYLLGPEFIPMSVVERIEVLRGPVSSVYGAGALVGAINVVTRRPPYEGEPRARGWLKAYGSQLSQRGYGGEISAAVTSQNLFLGAAAAGEHVDRSGLSIPTASPFANPSLGESERDFNRPRSSFARGEYALAGGVLAGSWVQQVHDVKSEFNDLAVLGHRAREQLSLWKATLGYSRLLGERLSVHGQMAYSSGGTGANDQYYRAGDPFKVRRDAGFTQYSGSVDLTYELGEGSFLLVGADGYADQERLPSYTEVRLDTGAATARPAPAERQLTNRAGYAQAVVQPAEWLVLAAGLRGDDHSVFGFNWAGRLAAVVPIENRVFFKVIVGNSYKAPSPEQLYGVPVAPLDVSGDTSVKPQFMRSVEGVVDAWLRSWLNLSATGFYNRYDDALAYVASAGRLVPRNYNAKGYGGELAARLVYHLPFDLRLEGAVSYSAQQTKTEERDFAGFVTKDFPDNAGAAQHAVQGWVNLESSRLHSNLHLAYRWVGARTPSQSNLLQNGTADMAAPNYSLGDYQVLDATLSLLPVRVVEKVQARVKLRATNLLDERYLEVGFNGVDPPSLGRTLWLETELSF